MGNDAVKRVSTMRQAYIVGHPVAHSKSPVMHNAMFQTVGAAWHYDFADCQTEVDARMFLQSASWDACNVTMPYKPLALKLATQASTTAVVAGGANVLIRAQDGHLYADNTDGLGCVAYLRYAHIALEGARVVVCGTGPTALSIASAFGASGASAITLLSRHAQRARQALQHIRWPISAPTSKEMPPPQAAAQSSIEGAVLQSVSAQDSSQKRDSHGMTVPDEAQMADLPGASFAACTYVEADDILKAADIIVDATSLGMNPNDPAPFDTSVLHAHQTVLDVVYGQGITALVAAARTAGCSTFDGAGMLVGQAVATQHCIQNVLGGLDLPSDAQIFNIMAKAASFSL